MKKQHQIISWKRNSAECGFKVITSEGNALFIEDYDSSLTLEINNEINGIHILPIEYGKDYQFDTPTSKRDPNKLDYGHVVKCKIIADEVNVKKLLHSIGWSTEDRQQVYKTPLTQDLEMEMDRLRFTINELLTKLNQ